MAPEKFSTSYSHGSSPKFSPEQRNELARELGARKASEATQEKIQKFIIAAEETLRLYCSIYNEVPETTRSDGLRRLEEIRKHASLLSIQLKTIPRGLASVLSAEVRTQTRLDEKYTSLKTKIFQKDDFRPMSKFNDFDLSDVGPLEEILDLITLASSDLHETITNEVPSNISSHKLRERQLIKYLAKDYKTIFNKPPGKSAETGFYRYLSVLGPMVGMTFGDDIIKSEANAKTLTEK